MSLTQSLILRRAADTLLDLPATPDAARFAHLRATVRTQPGCLGQCWGHQVEDPTIFVWYIDWQSWPHYNAFVTSAGHDTFQAELTEVFNRGTPLTTFTRWSSAAAAALASPVTEIAFLTLPCGYGADEQKRIEDALVHVMEGVTTVGKAWGAALGWVFETLPHGHAAAADGQTIALHGVFGYASIEDHMRWRETPEHAQATATMAQLVGDVNLGSADIHGSDMFHVAFHRDV